jgi:catechol 2,3-dioxygenase-like lactoylglutathione lyase family enzyme
MTSSPPTSPLARIGQIAIPVQDVPRAVAFYRDQLGLRFLFEAPPSMAFLDCGGVRLMLAIPEAAHDHPGSIVYFTVGDIDAAHQELQDRGVPFIDAPHVVARLGGGVELWMAFLRDPDGNVLGLMQERRAG